MLTSTRAASGLTASAAGMAAATLSAWPTTCLPAAFRMRVASLRKVSSTMRTEVATQRSSQRRRVRTVG
jgi:hypothetical protein